MTTRSWLVVMTAFAIGYALGDAGDALEMFVEALLGYLGLVPWACC